MPDLAKFLKDRLSRARSVAVLGIGSELRADDAAGLLVARQLERHKGRARKKRGLKIFFGGTAPENLTGEIKRSRPSHLIIIDAVEIGERPGTILVLDSRDLGWDTTFSTHKIPARVLIDYLLKSFKCDILMIGVQPSSLEFGKPASRHVKESAKEIASAIRSAL